MNFEKIGVANLDTSTEIVPFDMGKTKSIVLEKAMEDKASVLALTDKLDLSDTTSIVTFGKEAADEISKCSDTILNSVELDKIAGVGEMMSVLTNIMTKFDVNELVSEKKGVFSKFFGDAKSQLDKILNKYNTMGGEVDKIYVELKKYEADIGKSTSNLEELYQQNIGYYTLLSQYILAGEEGSRQIDAYRATVQANFDATGDTSLQFQLQNLEMGKQILEQRVQDLRVAETVALQSIPMIKSMQYSNLNLSRKINSAFIITLPIFKQSLAQAILLKRQKIQADALSALDEKTNEMLLKNAQNTVDQVKLTTQLASGSSVKMETLEQTWSTIMQGIEETKRIQEEASVKRVADAQKLEQMKVNFKTKCLPE